MKRHFLYRSTNIFNGKIYIGIHSSTNIHSDLYSGSGTLFLKALKKYGRKNFIREILAETSSRLEIEELEALLVTKEFCKLKSNYNVAPGGRGGCGKLEVSFEERSRRWKAVVKRTMTPEIRKTNGLKSGKTQAGRTKITHSYLAKSAEIRLLRHGKRLSKLYSDLMKRRWVEDREKCMLAIEKTTHALRGRTKENDAGRLSQSIKISGNNNPMKRADVLEHFIGKTKENCEWRARQAATISTTQANFSPEKKAEIRRKKSLAVRGEKNPMFGKYGELSPVSKYTSEQHHKAKMLFQEGISRKSISSQLGVNYQTVKVWLRGL